MQHTITTIASAHLFCTLSSSGLGGRIRIAKSIRIAEANSGCDRECMRSVQSAWQLGARTPGTRLGCSWRLDSVQFVSLKQYCTTNAEPLRP